jgi:hypothetical protein
MDNNIDIDRFEQFILYEEYALDEGGNVEMILNFIEWINGIRIINYTKTNSINNINILNKNIIDKTLNGYKQYSIKILKNKYHYIPLQLPKHLVGFFIFQIEEDNYDISIINTGGGCDYQKIFNKEIYGKKINFTNGIIIFRNISNKNALDFIQYILFLQNEKDKIELSLDSFNEMIYTSILDKLLNFEPINFNSVITKKNILFELPTQIIGDCSLKSFIYSYMLMDFYGLIEYNISGYNIKDNKFDSIGVNSEKSIENSTYSEKNVLRSLENYWNFYSNIFVKLMRKHILKIKDINFDSDIYFRKDKITPEYSGKIINFYFSSLYIIKEKSYINNSIYKFYSKKDLDIFLSTQNEISKEIISLSQLNLKKYNTDLLKKIDETNFKYWLKFPDSEYIKISLDNKYNRHEYEQKKNFDLNLLYVSINDIYLFGFNLDLELESEKNLTSNDDTILKKKLNDIITNLYNINLVNDKESYLFYAKVYAIYKKILDFLYLTKLIIYSYENYLSIIDLINKLHDLKIEKKYSFSRYDNNIKFDFKKSTETVKKLINSFLIAKIINYKTNIISDSNLNLELKIIYKLLFFPEFNEINEKQLNSDLIKKFISKKFYKNEIFDDDVDKYIGWIQDYFYSDKINYNLILFTIKKYSELYKFLFEISDKRVETELTDTAYFKNYVYIINFINDIKKEIISDDYKINDQEEEYENDYGETKDEYKWLKKYKEVLNTKELFDKITSFDKNSIEKLIDSNIDNYYKKAHHYIDYYKKNINIPESYLTTSLIEKIYLNFQELIQKIFNEYLKNYLNDNIVKLFFQFININYVDSKNKHETSYYLKCLDFVNPYESDDLSNNDYIEDDYDDDRDYYDDYYGGDNSIKKNFTGGKRTFYSCNYNKCKYTLIDIHYLVECVNNLIIPDIFYKNFFFIQHNYYVKNITSDNKVYENDISSFKLFNSFIKKKFESNINTYLNNLINKIPLVYHCVDLIIISCELLLFSYSIDVKILDLYKIINMLWQYIKIYFNTDNKESLTIHLNSSITLLVGIVKLIENQKEKNDFNEEKLNNIKVLKNELISSITDNFKKLCFEIGHRDENIYLKEKYFWFLASVPNLFDILESCNKKYIVSNINDTYDYDDDNFILINKKNKIYVKPKRFNNYNSNKTEMIELIIDKSTNKLYNYISYYCYLLNNFFTWEKVCHKYVFGKLKESISNNLFNYSIMFDNSTNKYYKVNQKNIDIIIGSISCNEKSYENILSEKIDDYIKGCLFLLDENEIIELINTNINLTKFINKINKFIVYEQLMFWKDPVGLSVQIEIPEYNLSFTVENRNEFGINPEKPIKFKNYDVIFNYEQEDTMLIFNLVSNVPNLFLIKNSQENEFYLLNINNLFYWDIIKIHYSNLFILFENDVGLLNYLSVLKNYWANHIIIKNIKNNITFQKIFNTDIDTNTVTDTYTKTDTNTYTKTDTNTDAKIDTNNTNTNAQTIRFNQTLSIQNELKKIIKEKPTVLYDKMINFYTKKNFFENIYKEYVIDLSNLTKGYTDKINRLWIRFNLPVFFEIQDIYILKKIFYDCIYLENLNYYLELLTNNFIEYILYSKSILIESINKQKKLYDKMHLQKEKELPKKYSLDSNYDSDYNSDYSGGGKKHKKKDSSEKIKSNILKDAKIINKCQTIYGINYELTLEFIEEIKKIYKDSINKMTIININFSSDELNCFIDTFYQEYKLVYTNTVNELNLYWDDYDKKYKDMINLINSKKESDKKISDHTYMMGGGLPKIPELQQYKSYQDHTNKNDIILIEWISLNDKNKTQSTVKKNNLINSDLKDSEKIIENLRKKYEELNKKYEENKDSNQNFEQDKKKSDINIWDKWDSPTINLNPLDIKITDEIINSLETINFLSFVNKIIILYNDKIADLFYNSSEFRYICLMFLFKKIKSKGLLDTKSNFHINTTLTMIFYQFVMGGLIRDDQIKIISSILSDYGFNNKYLDIITNTYNKDKKCAFRDIVKQGSGTNELYFSEVVFLGESKRNIYNLIMGSGKTKFITPLICIYVCEIIKNKHIDNNMLLILPPKLVNQSKIFLSYILEYFLNISVEQIDKHNLNILNSFNSSGKLLLCSDENFKYYFLGIGDKNGKFIFNEWNRFKNIVLIDEADIILDPMSSEMNYPLEKSKKYFNQTVYLELVDIVFDLFVSENPMEAKNTLIAKAKLLNIDIDLYINFINFIKSNNYSEYKIHDVFDLYNKKNPNINEDKLNNLKKINLDINIYNMYDYIYNIFLSVDTVWNMVNRKDFGFVSEKDEIITPFKYSETPIIGSEFNGIFMNMMLTVKAYKYDEKISFYKLCKLMKFIILKLQNTNYEKFDQNEFYIFVRDKFNFYQMPNILFRFNINLEDSNSINNLITSLKKLNFYSQIVKMLSDKDIIIMYAKHILYSSLYYYEEQLNISGIDLTFSSYFNYLSGFTGTPEDKFEYIDINPLQILKKNPTSVCGEKDALKNNTTVLNYNFDLDLLNIFGENYDYKNFILKSITTHSKYNVIIDVGSVFINFSFNQLAELFFKYFKHIERFIFIDNNDEIFYIDKKDIFTFIPWDYSIFLTDLVFFDNSHTTGIDFVLPNNFIGLITMRANTRYRDFIQGLYRLRKINSTQKADIFILPNVFSDPIITNQFTNLLTFKEKSTLDKTNITTKIAQTNLKINDIIDILEINEQYYFMNQQYYFNIEKLRVIKTFYKNINSITNPNEIIDSFIKITNSLDDYLSNKIINEIKFIEKNYVLTQKNFIEKYFSKNFNDILDKIFQITKFYKKILSSDTMPNLSVQMQIQTQQQYQNVISISVQTQINRSFSNANVCKNINYAFDGLSVPKYSNFTNIDVNSLVTEKKEDSDSYNSYYSFDETPKKFINTYIINDKNYKQTNLSNSDSSNIYIFSLSDCLMYANQLTIIYKKMLYVFNSFLIIYLKNIKNDYTFLNKKNINLFKAGEFYEILNLSVYYKKANIPHVVYDVFGNQIVNHQIIPNEYEKSLSSNIKYYFASIFLMNSKSYDKFSKNYFIPNHKYIFNYQQMQKIICGNDLNLSVILNIFESINLSNHPTVFSLEKIYCPVIFTVILMLLGKDPLLSKNIDVNKFIKNNFITNTNSNLTNEFIILINEIKNLWINKTFEFIQDIYNNDNNKYKICDNTNFYYLNQNSIEEINFNLISKCVGKILKKDKIWSEKDNTDLKESLNIFKIITRLFVPINNELNLELDENKEPTKLIKLFEKYLNFIILIQSDSINPIDPTDRLNYFFKNI